MAVIGATMLDSGGPALKTLMAVGTNVPYWVGTTQGDHVVKLTVPKGLTTMSFKLNSDLVRQSVLGAKVEAGGQIDEILRAKP